MLRLSQDAAHLRIIRLRANKIGNVDGQQLLSFRNGVSGVNEDLQHAAVERRQDFRVAGRVRFNGGRSGDLAVDGGGFGGYT